MMFMGFGFVLTVILICILIAYLGWRVISEMPGKGTSPVGRDKKAVEILEQRYARGEINRQEFEQIRDDLR